MATVKELKAELDAKGIEYDSKAKKDELEALLASDDSPPPAEPAPEVPVADDAPGSEGPTELTPEPEEPASHIREPEKGDLVVVSAIMHQGREYPIGCAAPADLSDQQIERLKRLGCLE